MMLQSSISPESCSSLLLLMGCTPASDELLVHYVND